MGKREYRFDKNGNGRPQGQMDNEKGTIRGTTGIWKKLFRYCRRYLAIIIIAILCASVGTVLTLIGPDKLSEMTDTITNGIMPGAQGIDMDRVCLLYTSDAADD